MKHSVALLTAVSLLASCRTYDYRDRISQDAGLMPAEQYAKYGREQAELVAAGRELAHAAADSAQQAASYARGLPDVADVTTDPRGHWLTIRFKSGWRAAVPPIADGKRGAETAGVPAKAHE
jgi:hypothetical protein